MKKRLLPLICAVLVIGGAITLSLQQKVSATVPGVNALISVNNTGNGQGGDFNSPFTSGAGLSSQVSGNGRYVVFNSSATNLVPGDTNAHSDIFVRDLVNSTTQRVDVSATGVQANGEVNTSGDYTSQAISRTGRYIVFTSQATNLIDGQTTPAGELYMKDTTTNALSIVTQKADGTLGNGLVKGVVGVSSDGRFVAWYGARNTNLNSGGTSTVNSDNLYIADLSTRTFNLLDAPATNNLWIRQASMSCDGSELAFGTNTPIDSSDTDSSYDVYLVDVRNGESVTGLTTSASNTTRNSFYPSISCNGDYVTFASDDYVFSSLVSSSSSLMHQYLYNRVDNTFSVVDASTSGVLGNNNSATQQNAVDDNGNVFFGSNSSNLIDGQTTTPSQVYLKHNDTGVMEIASKTVAGAASNGGAGSISTSADGRQITYSVGVPTTLLSSDTNARDDIIGSKTGL